MDWLIRITCILVCCPQLLQGKASEYQLESESLTKCESLRAVAVAKQRGDVPQCTEDGRFSAMGGVRSVGVLMLKVKRSTGLEPAALLQAVCLPASCSQSCSVLLQDSLSQFSVTPAGGSVGAGSCEVRERRLLHGSGSSSPPQCAEDGHFLPVQCKFINMTDRTELDLLHAFNRFPEAFQTFGRFRSFFPLVSSYCFCSDSRGRELQNTGVELLLSEVYDSAFSGLVSGRSFSQTNIYRVLQRRMLGVRLVLTGHFRCPSPCEEERRAAMEASGVFVPSCESGGSFSSRQCQQGGQCWCVDPTGRELPGTRQHGDSLVCSSGLADCPSQRRLALSRLLSGPIGPPLPASLVRSPVSCRFLIQPLRDLLPVEVDPTSFLSHLVEVLHGLFPSVGGALQALGRSSPRRLQENLFGGKFLKNAVAFNLSGAVGARGALGLDRLSSQDVTSGLQENRALVQSVSRALEDPALLAALRHTLMETSSSHSASLQQVLAPLLRSCSSKDEDDVASIFVPSCTSSGGFQQVQCRAAECWCVNSQGQEVTGSRTTGRRPRCPTHCETERAVALKVRENMAAGAELHIPACSEDGDFLPLQCVGSRCFCVDADGKTTGAGSAGGAVACPETTGPKLQSSAGSCSQVFADVTAFRQEVKRIVMLSNSSHLPLGYGFLLAEGLRLTPEELQISQSEEELQVSDRLLSHSNAALRLAASSSLTHCQRAQSRSLLSGWMKGSDVTKCEKDGRFSLLQTGGATGWCVNPLTGDKLQTASPGPDGQLTCPSWCELQGLQCRPDGSFIPLQCDVTSCWCVSDDGQEVGGTRSLRQTGHTPSCDRPLCPNLAVTHGALVCHPTANGRQSCDLVCHRGYQNSLPVKSFLCEMDSRQWEGDNIPLPGACQTLDVVVILRSDQQLPVSGRSLSLCDGSSVRLQCDSDDALTLTVRWTAVLSDLPTSDLPNLHDIGLFLNESRLLEGVRELLRDILTSEPKLVSMTTLSFGCSRGYHLNSDGEGCVVCSAGSFSREGACLPCPLGTYQDEEGRDFCKRCPRGSSAAGASSVNQCVTECQKRGLRCSNQGDFLSAQPDFLSGRWRCVNSEGAELEWTNSDTPLNDNECSVQPSCHHVALFNRQTQCELYSTHTLNTHCNTSQKTSGFLGNLQAEQFDWLSCSLRVRGGASDLLVIRKKGAESPSQQQQQQSFVRMRMMKAVSGVFRTQVFSSTRTSLSDAHRFCQDGCSHDTCCHGFILNQNSLNGGSLLCGWLRAPSVLMCRDQDWDVTGQGTANRICGAGLNYNEQQKSFELDFGGQTFTITDSALPADSRNKKDYQASIVSFQAVYLNTDAESAGSGSSSCAAAELRPPLDEYELKTVVTLGRVCVCVCVCIVSVQLQFESLSEDDVLVDPQRKLPALSFWLNKLNYDSQQALLWCLTRCDAEQQCSIADLRDADSAGFFSCSLFPDSRVCGAYDKPLRRPCRPLLDRTPNNTYSRKVSGDQWRLLTDSAFLIDPSVSTYDVIHVSRDIAADQDKTRDWCLHACQEAESCVAVSVSEVESATRCVLYPDTTACGLSSASSSSCRLVIREPAPQVYMRTERAPTVTSVSIPGHGTLQGVAVETVLGSDRKTVVKFLGVPYAHPPIGSLRFTAAQPADWMGSWDATKPRPSCVQPGDAASAASSEDCLYLNIFSPAANQSPGLLDGSTLAAMGNVVVVTASYRTAALGFLSTGSSGLRGNYGLSDQEAVLHWVNTHISLVGGDSSRVTVGAERRGADITSLHLLSSSPPLFQRLMLMGGSVFSPSLVQTPSTSRSLAVDLAKQLGCVTSDDNEMAACLRATPVHTLNAAQTKLMAVSGPFQSWSPVRQSVSRSSFYRVDLLLGTSEHDGLISRARRIKDFEALQGRADGKTAFYEALSRSLGGAKGSELLKEAAAWFYSLNHSPSPSGYNLFSRALNNATRDLFIICPSLQMASHWANSKANVFLYHQPATNANNRADVSIPLDVQFVFGTPHHPMSSQRFTSSERHLSLAMMTYVSSFIRTGNPNPSRVWADSVLPRWQPVLSSVALPTYLQLSPALGQQQGLHQETCSFWNQLGARLTSQSSELGAEPVQTVLTTELPLAAPSSQSQTEKDAYS
ncbi:hypothetical protein PAMA_015705 [Pampus argenteus]